MSVDWALKGRLGLERAFVIVEKAYVSFVIVEKPNRRQKGKVKLSEKPNSFVTVEKVQAFQAGRVGQAARGKIPQTVRTWHLA